MGIDSGPNGDSAVGTPSEGRDDGAEGFWAARRRAGWRAVLSGTVVRACWPVGINRTATDGLLIS
jgi:hypothetical protein